MMKYKIWDIVLLPRFWNYNPKFDRDVCGKIQEVRQWRLISYRIWSKRYLEDILRPVNSNSFNLISKD